MLDRRDFMKRGIAFGSILALPRMSWAQGAAKEPGARTLVMLHLNGGNDNQVRNVHDQLTTVRDILEQLHSLAAEALGVDS